MSQSGRFAEIDLLRFLAALAVMIAHYGLRGFAYGDSSSPLHFPEMGTMLRYNYLAVNLFFMISGFVILMTVQGHSLREFAISRVVRLYPAYWVCCTLTFLVVLLFSADQFKTSLSRYLANMTMLNGFVNIGYVDGPYWTLCVELKFYFLMGLLVATTQLANVRYYVGLWLAISGIQLLYPSPIVSYLLIPEYSAYFCAGCLFFLIYSEGPTPYKIFLLAASFIVAVAYDAPLLIDRAIWYRMNFDATVLIGILSSFYLAFFWITRRRRPAVRYGATFVFLGTISYPLYLIHHNFGLVLFNVLHDHLNRYVLLWGTVVAMICLARLIHVFVERRYSRRLKAILERLSSNWQGRLRSVPSR